MAAERPQTFADLLRHARREAELTQEELAERAGVSARGISDLERGIIRTPRRDTLELLLDALDVPAERRGSWHTTRDEALSQPVSSEPTPALSNKQPLVGRDRELTVLRNQLEFTFSGRGGVVLVSGEPGIGKTHLIHWLAAEAARNGAAARWGHSYEGEGAPAFWPWVQILRSCLSLDDADTLQAEVGPDAAHLAQIVPEIEQTLPDLTHLPPMNPEQARFHLFHAVTQTLHRQAAIQPLVILLEDIHWADTPTLLLLEFLARELRESALLIVATYRNVEVQRDHPLSATLASLAREPVVDRLTLRRLTEEEVGSLIEQIVGPSPSRDMTQAIWRETDGNPFFVIEVVRLLEDEGDLVRAVDLQQVFRIPESIREAIGQRLSRLSVECNDLLIIAAVAGREFNLPILETTSGKPALDLLKSLDEAEQAQIIEEGDAFGRYRFSHRLIQETLYDELSTSQRIQLHSQLAAALEERYATDLREHYGTLAHHYAQSPLGPNIEKGIDYATRAAERALRQVAWEEAVSYYELALQILELHADPTPEQQCELLLALGSAQDVAGSGRGSTPGTADATDARNTYWRAVDAARAAGSITQLARATVGVAYGLYSGVPITDQRIVPLLEEVHSMLPVENSVERALIQVYLAAAYRNFKMFCGVHFARGTESVLEQLSADAVVCADRMNDELTMVICRIARHHVISHPGHSDELRSLANELVDIDLPNITNHDDILSSITHAAFRTLMSDGNMAAGKRLIDRMTTRSGRATLSSCVFQAGIALSEGRYEGAEALLAKADAVWPNTGIVCNQTFALYREQDRLGDVESRLQPILHTLPRAPWFRMTWILYLLETGQEKQARRLFRDVDVHDLSDLARGTHWPHVLAICAELSIAFEDEERARICYELLEPYPDHVIYCGYIYYCAGSVSHYLGLLATMFGEWDTAEHHFTHALQTHEDMGFHPLVAYTQIAWARMLLQRGEPYDRKRAQNFIAQASETADRLDMIRLQRLIANA